MSETKTVKKIVMRDPAKLISAEYNPRKISDDQFSQLCDSIRRGDFIEPVVVNKNADRMDIIVSGHQRCRAAIAIGLKKIPTVEVDYDEAREREMNVRMNKNTGEFDLEILTNEFEVGDLTEWGFEIEELENEGPPDGEGGDIDAGGEIDVDEFSDKMTIKLEYVMDEYEAVRDALAEHGQTPEQAVWKLLGFDNA